MAGHQIAKSANQILVSEEDGCGSGTGPTLKVLSPLTTPKAMSPKHCTLQCGRLHTANCKQGPKAVQSPYVPQSTVKVSLLQDSVFRGALNLLCPH